MPRVLLVALLLATAIAVPAGAASAAGTATVPKDWFGVVADGPLTAPGTTRTAEWKRVGTSGAGLVRTAFYWRELEPRPGVFAFAAVDRVVLAAARNGLDVLPVVHDTPEWAWKYAGNFESPPANPADYATFLTALVARYGPKGTLWTSHPQAKARPIRQWQIWNEPSLQSYWYDRPFAPSYVDLLRAARPALRAADPGAKLVLAGFPNRSWEALRAIYAAGGHGLFDAVALHPYVGTVTNILRVIRLARSAMKANGDAALPIWLTEVSFPASRGVTKKPESFETTASGQATLLRRTFEKLAAERKRLNIGHVIWYTWLSAEGKQAPLWSSYSGLRRVRRGKTVSTPALGQFISTVAQLTGRARTAP
jgi:hypothetical protein